MTAECPPVAIIMGSQSDWETMKNAADTLDQLDVGYEARIVSAHRTPDRMVDGTQAPSVSTQNPCPTRPTTTR